MRSVSCRKVDCEHWEKLREEKVVLHCVAWLLRAALLKHESEIKEEMGIEDEPETTES